MAVFKDWLTKMLTPARQEVELWQEYAETIETTYDNEVAPTVTRLHNMRSLFTMDSQDIDRRMSELGQFFVIRSDSESDKPMNLIQRLDEIHFKGTEIPIASTFWREFKSLPAEWSPLYMPVDIAKYPYGSVLVEKDALKIMESHFGEFNLTSRGVIKISVNDLYEKRPDKTQDEVFFELIRDIDLIIRPLLPAHIVFDGFRMVLLVTIYEPLDRFKLTAINSQTSLLKLHDGLDVSHLARVDSEFMVKAFARYWKPMASLGSIDHIPLDGWMVDFPVRSPIVIDSPNENRYFFHDGLLCIENFGYFSCVVSFEGNRAVKYEFPDFAKYVQLPITEAEAKSIHTISYSTDLGDEKVIEVILTDSPERVGFVAASVDHEMIVFKEAENAIFVTSIDSEMKEVIKIKELKENTIHLLSVTAKENTVIVSGTDKIAYQHIAVREQSFIIKENRIDSLKNITFTNVSHLAINGRIVNIDPEIDIDNYSIDDWFMDDPKHH